MSLVTRSYRLRAYPNGAQRQLLDRWFGATRWLWNTALEIRSEAYRTRGLSLTGIDLSRWLTRWKRTAGHEWLAEVPATALTQCLRDQDRAFSRFFARRTRYPRFKPKCGRQSLRFQGAGTPWRSGGLRLPKLGVLKLAEELPEVERPDMVSLLRDASGAYYVSFCAKVPRTLRPGTGELVGVARCPRDLRRRIRRTATAAAVQERVVRPPALGSGPVVCLEQALLDVPVQTR
jgi:putative transposase